MNFNLPQPRNKRSFQSEGPHNKRAKPVDDFLDLPTHLPNCSTSDHANDPAKPAVLENGASAMHGDDRDSKPSRGGASQAVEVDQPKEAIFIEGTNITLQTEEDIAAWIAERKKNWPTRQNIQRKLALKAESQEPALKKQPGKNAEPTKRNICKYFAKNNRCKFGAKCKKSHDLPKSSTKATINGIEVSIPKRYKDSTEKGSLFTNLVQRDLYANENDFVLSFLQYLNSKHIIDIDADYA